jgi:hypothetical protein
MCKTALISAVSTGLRFLRARKHLRWAHVYLALWLEPAFLLRYQELTWHSRVILLSSGAWGQNSVLLKQQELVDMVFWRSELLGKERSLWGFAVCPCQGTVDVQGENLWVLGENIYCQHQLWTFSPVRIVLWPHSQALCSYCKNEWQ